MAWHESLPTWILDNLDCFTHVDTESKIESYWAWAYNLLFYHSLVIKLQRTVLHSKEHDISIDQETIRRNILGSCQFISTLCFSFLNKKSSFQSVSPLVNLWIFEGGVGWICACKDSDPATSLLFKHGMAVIFQCLDQNGPLFQLAEELSRDLNMMHVSL